METRSIHFKSDFLVRLMNEVDWSTPFSIRFFTTRAVSAKVVAYDGENYVGCELDESTGALLVPFERFTEIYRQGLGTLRMELTYRLSNSLYPDQYQDVVLPAQPVVCTNDQDEQFYLSLALTGDDDVEVSASVVAPFMVGPQGTAGTGISTMVQTSASMASAGANVWKMTLTDGREFSFTVLNGEKGDTGAQGPQGPQGPQGAKGDKGDKGDTGARGPQGEQGPRGVPGQRGEKGAKGDKGDRGLTGESGPAGSTPLIGQNGNWWVGGTDTGVKADYSGTEAQRQETFEANEANRQEEFDSKEATRDAANEAALNCADTLAALGPKIEQVEKGKAVLSQTTSPTASIPLGFTPTVGNKYYVEFDLSAEKTFAITLRSASGSSGAIAQTIESSKTWAAGHHSVPFVYSAGTYLRIGEAVLWPNLSNIAVYCSLKEEMSQLGLGIDATNSKVDGFVNNVGKYRYAATISSISTTPTKLLDVDIKSGQSFYLLVNGSFGDTRIIIGVNGGKTPRILDTNSASATENTANKIGVRYLLKASADITSINIYAGSSLSNIAVTLDVDVNLSQDITSLQEDIRPILNVFSCVRPYKFSASIVNKLSFTPSLVKIPAGKLFFVKVGGIPDATRIILATDSSVNNRVLDRRLYSSSGQTPGYNTIGEYIPICYASDISELYFWSNSALDITLSVEIFLSDDRQSLPTDTASILTRSLFGGAAKLKKENVSLKTGYYNTAGMAIGSFYGFPPFRVRSYDYTKCAILEISTQSKTISVLHLENIVSFASGIILLLDKNGYVLHTLNGEFTNTCVAVPNGVAYVVLNTYADTQSALDLHSVSVWFTETYTNLLNEMQTNPLFGRNIVAMGDSITAMSDSSGKRWSDYFKKMYGANVVNIAVGGSHIEAKGDMPTDPTDPNYNAYRWLSIISIVSAIVEEDVTNVVTAANSISLGTSYVQRLNFVADNLTDIDAVVIFSGTNGSDYLSDKGTTDWDDYDTTKQFSALNAAIKLLYSKNPNLSVFVFTPIPRYYGEDWNDWNDDYYSDNYIPSGFSTPAMLTTVNGIKEVAKNNSVPCCDLYRTLGINRYNFSSWFSGVDGVHPKLGFERIARKIGQFIISEYNLLRN